tara:strand:- start:3078 stop:3812 length:735 start_codon:yes stop_codon:yes gene_type:complete
MPELDPTLQQTDSASTLPTKQVIEVSNPSPEEMKALCADIKVNFDFSVNVVDCVFNFKKSKDKNTDIEIERKPVSLAIPFVSVDGIIAILEAGGKQLELLQDAMENVVKAQAREILSDNYTLTAATFPVEKLSWKVISEIPKVQRRGGGIPKEVWEAFTTDYTACMPAATGKSLEQVANMAKILGNKLVAIRTHEAALQLAVEQLTIYTATSENVEEFQECIEFLVNKAENFLNVSDEELLANL